MHTLYDVLGIAATASNADIKAAYRRLAMQWHPDRNRENVAEAVVRFQEVNSAYAVLSDDQRRAQYDESIQGATETRDSAQNAWDEMLSFAATLANAGHNRDVILGALLAHGCPADIAQTVADASVHAAQPRDDASKGPSVR
jgi:DnaJ-class molecular chaperone